MKGEGGVLFVMKNERGCFNRVLKSESLQTGLHNCLCKNGALVLMRYSGTWR